jgi:heme exporter protein D
MLLLTSSWLTVGVATMVTMCPILNSSMDNTNLLENEERVQQVQDRMEESRWTRQNLRDIHIREELDQRYRIRSISSEHYKRSLSRKGSIETLQFPHNQVKNQMMNKGSKRQIRRKGYINHSSCGMEQKLKHKEEKSMRIERRPDSSLVFSRRTLPLLNERFKGLHWHHKDSWNQNGDISSKEKLLTLTLSSAISITLPHLRRMWVTLEEQKFLLERQIQLEKSKWVVTGQLHGMQPPKQQCMLSHIQMKSFGSGETT